MEEFGIDLLSPKGNVGEDKMGVLSLRLPESIHRHIREIAKQEGVSVNQLISSAVIEKVTAVMTEAYVLVRAKRANLSKTESILDKVRDREPLPGDAL